MQGGLVKLLGYVIPLSATAVLVFAAIAAAQSVPQGQEATTPTESIASAPNKTITRGTLPINDHAFDPAQLSIASGTTLTIVNTDPVKHTATADNGLFDTGVLEPGESFEIYFEGSGTVTYHCELHPEMKGSIVVGEGVGAEDTAPQPRMVEDAPISESSSEAEQPSTEAAQPHRGY
jgi:plastocyanin